MPRLATNVAQLNKVRGTSGSGGSLGHLSGLSIGGRSNRTNSRLSFLKTHFSTAGCRGCELPLMFILALSNNCLNVSSGFGALSFRCQRDVKPGKSVLSTFSRTPYPPLMGMLSSKLLEVHSKLLDCLIPLDATMKFHPLQLFNRSESSFQSFDHSFVTRLHVFGQHLKGLISNLRQMELQLA